MRERRRAHRLLCMRRDDRLSYVRDGRYRLVYGYRLLYVRRHRLGMRKVRQRHRRVGRRRDVRLLRRADGRRLSDAGRRRGGGIVVVHRAGAAAIHSVREFR